MAPKKSSLQSRLSTQRLALDLSNPDALDASNEAIRNDLSVVAQSGRCLWLASDETATIERLDGDMNNGFGRHVTYKLGEFFDLPDGPEGEVDIEGLAVDPPYLWVAGSHSLGRQKPKPDGHDSAECLSRLTEIKSAANRFLLGRIPLVPTKQKGKFILQRNTADPRGGPDLTTACLKMKRSGNSLTRSLKKDVHISRFLDIPAKENGFDVEGLAVRGDRIFLGLRGPVLRGWAVILELAVEAKKTGRLKLRPVGPDGQKYRKHFLDLKGLGIRELDCDGNDLVILAGPTMDLDGPVVLYRWPDALDETADQAIVPHERLTKLMDVPYGKDSDNAEGIALYREQGQQPRLLIVYDNPAPDRLHKNSTGVDADLFPLRTQNV